MKRMPRIDCRKFKLRTLAMQEGTRVVANNNTSSTSTSTGDRDREGLVHALHTVNNRNAKFREYGVSMERLAVFQGGSEKSREKQEEEEEEEEKKGVQRFQRWVHRVRTEGLRDSHDGKKANEEPHIIHEEEQENRKRPVVDTVPQMIAMLEEIAFLRAKNASNAHSDISKSCILGNDHGYVVIDSKHYKCTLSERAERLAKRCQSVNVNRDELLAVYEGELSAEHARVLATTTTITTGTSSASDAAGAAADAVRELLRGDLVSADGVLVRALCEALARGSSSQWEVAWADLAVALLRAVLGVPSGTSSIAVSTPVSTKLPTKVVLPGREALSRQSCASVARALGQQGHGAQAAAVAQLGRA